MRNNIKYLIIGLVMLVIGIIFMLYAINHPEGSFPWRLDLTYTIYLTYLGLTIYFIVKGCRKN